MEDRIDGGTSREGDRGRAGSKKREKEEAGGGDDRRRQEEAVSACLHDSAM